MSLMMLISDRPEQFASHLIHLTELYCHQQKRTVYAEAFSEVRACLPDFLIYHVHSGVEAEALALIQALQQDALTRAIPRLLLLADFSSALQLYWLRQGCVLCLPDTISPDDLHLFVQVALERHAQIRGELEQQLDAYEQQDLLYRRLLALLSHDLRSLFSSMHAAAELLPELTADAEAQERETVLQLFADSTRSGAFLLDAVLAYLQNAPADLARSAELVLPAVLLQEAADLLAFKSYSRKASISIEAEALKVKADARALFSVLFNLLDNALKCTPAGQPVRCVVKATSKALGAACQIQIMDSGPGFTALAAQSFLADGQARPSGDLSKGWGLGLWLSRQVLEQMGGELKIESSPRGSCFTVILPLADTVSIDGADGYR